MPSGNAGDVPKLRNPSVCPGMVLGAGQEYTSTGLGSMLIIGASRWLAAWATAGRRKAARNIDFMAVPLRLTSGRSS
jgi:hypothetical protein